MHKGPLTVSEGRTEDMRMWFGPLARLLVHFYARFSRALTLGVQAVVIGEDGRIFLVQHSYVPGWHLPGGGVEIGETIAEALARELHEEGNITLTGVPRLHGVFFNRQVSRRDHIAVFVVREFRQDGPPVPNREIVAHGFYPPERLPAETTPGARRRIAEVIDGVSGGGDW